VSETDAVIFLQAAVVSATNMQLATISHTARFDSIVPVITGIYLRSLLFSIP
jgi:hypothetical protein